MTQRSSAISPSQPDGPDCQLPRTRRAPGNLRGESSLGRAFADALARQDFRELGELLHPEIDFRALTPRRTWEPESHSQSLEVLRTWFGDCVVERVVRLEMDSFADRQRVAYRFWGHRPDGAFVIEQQVYFTERDGQVDWIRLMCSGFRAP